MGFRFLGLMFKLVLGTQKVWWQENASGYTGALHGYVGDIGMR